MAASAEPGSAAARDVERYPLLKQQMREMLATREAVGNYQPPKAIGEVCYIDDTELKAECADFRAVLTRGRTALSNRS